MRKAIAYVTRQGPAGIRELLVFEHRDYPEAGTEVPAGTVDERHVFHLAAPSNTAERWAWVETDGGKAFELKGYVFQFRWVRLDTLIELAGDQGDYLHLIR